MVSIMGTVLGSCLASPPAHDEAPADLYSILIGAGAVYAFGRTVYGMYGGSYSSDAMQEVYNMCVKPSVVVAHEKAAGDAGVVANVASAAALYGQGAVGPGITELNSLKTTITGEPEQVPTIFGSYTVQTYTTEIEECPLTYTCHYGRGFDEVRSLTLFMKKSSSCPQASSGN